MLQLGFDQRDYNISEWSYFRFQLLFWDTIYTSILFSCVERAQCFAKKNYEKENSQGKTFQNSFNIEV